MALRSRSFALIAAFAFAALAVAPLWSGTTRAAPGDLVATVKFSVDCSLGTGITFDGTSLWYSCVGKSPDLYRADPTTGTVTASYTIAGGLGSIAYDAARNVIWAGEGTSSFSGSVIKIPLDANHVVSGAFTPAFPVPQAAAGGCSLDDGLALDAVRNELLVSYDCSHNIYRYDADTGAFLGSVPFNGPSCYNSGVAIGGDLLYEGNDGCSHVWVVDKTTNAASYDFPTAVTGDPNFRDEGLTCDPVTFASQGKEVMWSKEAFSPMRAAAFEIQAGSCGFGGAPACTPDPTVTASVTRPALGKLYVNDAEHAGDAGVAVVIGDVTLHAAASDPARIGTARWNVDGTPIATGLVGAPWSTTWHASLATPGVHALTVTLTHADGTCATKATQLVSVATVSTESASRALFATTLQPEEPTVKSEGASVPGTGESWFRDQSVPQVGLRAQLLHDIATESAPGHAHAVSEVKNVSLLNGLVTASVLRAEATTDFDATAVAMNGGATGSYVAGLVVNGIPVAVDQPNTRVTLPGVGDLVLDEQTIGLGHTHAEVRVAALHFYPAHDGLRGEVILGQAVVGADIASIPFSGLAKSVDQQDDAGTGGDVGGTYQTGHTLAVGQQGDSGSVTIGGRVGGKDTADVYLVYATQGEKLEFVAQPSAHATVTTHTLPTPPAIGGATIDGVLVPNLKLRLLDPYGQRPLLTSNAPLGAPQRIELNVNESGMWGIEVTADDVVNYTLTATNVPIVLAAETPAGARCGDANAPMLASETPTTNSMGHQDTVQDYRIHANIGDDLAVALTMPDADGQDLDLRLYDSNCALISSSTLGKPILWQGDVPKGVSDAVTALPIKATGTYWVEVSRYVGAGNYVLTPHVGTVIPTIPGNDALTGADASNDCNAPTPLPLPDGVFEGRFDDGDPRDCYSVQLGAGDAMTVAFLPSPANSASMRVIGGGSVVSGTDTGDGAWSVQNRAATAQTVLIELTPNVGGGNYALEVTHAGSTSP